MTTILFVHGTGVRQPAFGAAFERFAGRVAAIRPDSTVAHCYWGDAHGAELHARGVSVPAGSSSRGPGDGVLDPEDDEDAEVALWGLLERDPLFELRLLAAESSLADSEELAPNEVLPGAVLAEAAARLPDDPDVMAAASAAGLDRVLPDAVAGILAEAETTAALGHESPAGGGPRTALALAIVAQSLRLADESLGGTLPFDGDHRDLLVAAVVASLGGSDRGVGSSLGRYGVRLALRMGAAKPLERRRAALTESAAPAAGDVLRYLTRGEPLRAFIEDAVTAVEGPVVLVAHSLGGIACLELLATKALPSVDLLVTVGSQAPLLYELDALPTLAFGEPLPASLPRWVNVYDRRDLLAYVGEGLFPGQVEDREIDNKVGFPRSHSAYFANKRFYALLDEVLP